MNWATSQVARIVNLIWRAQLENLAAHHHRHAVGHGQGFGLVMGDVNEGCRQRPMQLGQFRAHMHAQGGVQVGQRFVH